MASPQRKISTEDDSPPAPQPQLQKGHGPGAPPARRGWRLGYFWIALFLILGFWYVGFGWGNSGGWIWGHRNASVAVANDGSFSGTGVAILEVANRQDYVGQSFQIRSVAIDHWSSKDAVWIGSRHSYLPMLLVLPSPSPLAPPSAGEPRTADPGTGTAAAAGPPATDKVQRLSVTGKIMKAPPTAQAQSQWKLSDEDVDQLEEEGVYIQATSVQPVTH